MTTVNNGALNFFKGVAGTAGSAFGIDNAGNAVIQNNNAAQQIILKTGTTNSFQQWECRY